MPALFRTYRPKRFADVTEQEHVVRTLTQQILHKTLAQVYVFSGPRGVGKTTIARLLAASAQCTGRSPESYEACGMCPACQAIEQGSMVDTLEIDAASQTGVDAIRENVLEGVRFGPVIGAYKVFIIDEVHMLSTASFNALLKTLEEPPRFAIFILATTEIHKIPATVISRCQRFVFTRIPLPSLCARLRLLIAKEGRSVSEEVLLHIARLSEGCLRDAESMLGQVLAAISGDVSKEDAQALLPYAPQETVEQLVEAASVHDMPSVLGMLKKAKEEGVSLRHVHDALLEYLQGILALSYGANPPEMWPETTLARARAVVALISSASLIDLIDALLLARTKQAPALLPELPLTVAFGSWCAEPSASQELIKKANPRSQEDAKPSPSPTPVVQKVANPAVQSHTPHEEKISTASTAAWSMDFPQAPKENSRPASSSEESSNSLPHAKTWQDLEVSIREKWGRCIDKAKEAGPGYALMVGGATFAGMPTATTLHVTFPYQMHADRMQDPKNAKILLEALREVCLLPHDVMLKISREERKEEAEQEEVQDLLDAFGGHMVS